MSQVPHQHCCGPQNGEQGMPAIVAFMHHLKGPELTPLLSRALFFIVLQGLLRPCWQHAKVFTVGLL
jgi:hypothetical protein